MPGVQLLHCVELGGGVEGGESTLVDCMAAAYKLREVFYFFYFLFFIFFFFFPFPLLSFSLP